MHTRAVVEDGELEHFGRGGGGGASPGGEDGSSGKEKIPQRAYVTAILITLAGILMFFMAFASAYVVRKGSPGEDWRHLNVPRILWLNTAILLASSFTLTWSRSRFCVRDEREFHRWWWVTTILGIFFLIGQLLAWRQLSLSGTYLATNPAGSFFYILTAAHGLHLVAGIGVLLAVGFRIPRRISLTTAVDVAGIYWHSMDALWLLLFVFLLAN